MPSTAPREGVLTPAARVPPSIAPGVPARLAAFTSEVARESRELKRFLKLNLYDTLAIAEDRDRGVQALDELFRHYMDHPESMPPFYTAEATEPASAGGRAPELVVCDYVAGMTDHFLLRTHRELIGSTK